MSIDVHQALRVRCTTSEELPRFRTMSKELPNEIYIPCQGGVDNEYVAITGSDMPQNPYDLIELLKLEAAPRSVWRDVASLYFRSGSWQSAILVLEEATSEYVENVHATMDDQDGSSSSSNRLDLLSALGGAHIMMAEACVHDPEARRTSLAKAADVFSRADKIDLDDPSIWTARGWAEFHSGKNSAVSWLDNSREKQVVLGSVGLAALHLNRTKTTDPSRKDPVSLLIHALRSDVCPPGVWTGLAYALYKEGHMNAARNVARRALSALRESPPEERLEALQLLATIELVDRTESSIDDMALILHEAYTECGGDQDARTLTLIANLHFNGGDFEKAELFAQRAVDAANFLPGPSVGAFFTTIKNNTKVDSLFQLGRAQHHLRKFDEAMHSFMQIKTIADSADGSHVKINPGVLLRLGLLKLSTGRKADEGLAKECLEKVLKVSNDRSGTAKRALGVLIGREVLVGLRKGRPRGGESYERAVNLLRKGLDELKSGQCDVPAHLVYASLVEEYFPQKALESFKIVLKHHEESDLPVDEEIWNNYASLLARSGKVHEAKEIYDSKISDEFAENCTTVIYNRARIAEMSGEYEEAEKLYHSIKEDHPHYHEAIVRIAAMLMEKEDGMAEGEKLLKVAKEASVTRAVATAHLSSLYGLQKNYKQAQAELESHRHDCDYLFLLFLSFMHRFLDGLEQERRSRFLVNHIGSPLISILKRNSHNACAANGLGVYFAESKQYAEARDAFKTAGSGPLAERVARVNLAHVQMRLGLGELAESARLTGRPSLKVRTASRALYEQAGKLYSDALAVSELKGSSKKMHSYCEVLLYTAWAQFEGGEYEKSAMSLCKLVHIRPSCSVGWFNLSKALLEKALQRASSGGSQLSELRTAKHEFEGSRSVLQRVTTWKGPFPDPIARVRITTEMNFDTVMYVRQEAKSHDVKLRNAINMEDDRKEKMAAKAREIQAYEERQRELQQEKMAEKTRKEQELRRAFEESLRQQQENEENYQRILAAKRAAEEDENSGDEEGGQPSEKKSKSKRKRKESAPVADGDEDASSKKRKRPKKPPAKKKAKEIDASSDEYNSDAGGGAADFKEEDDYDLDDGKRKRADSGPDDDVEHRAQDFKRQRVDLDDISDDNDGQGRNGHAEKGDD